ncbi:MAG TPA: hypothetical protein VKM56_04430 [Verrucomicrobiae bacterium]|nr:hypothetical protein [Verrucomicrobiae bacterium]
MKWLDWVLNVAALLLWLNWRMYRQTITAARRERSLLVPLKTPPLSALRTWLSLLAIPVLLIVRAAVYRQLGSAINWTAQLNLQVIVLPFHSQFGPRMLLYSVLSFGWFLSKFYIWLIIISVLNQNDLEPGALLKYVRLQLGAVERWPVALKLALPVVTIVIAWLVVSAALQKMGIVPTSASILRVAEQGMLIGVAAYLSATYLLAVLLFLHLLNSYVYLGEWSIWRLASSTSQQLVKPFFGLRIGRFDLAALVGLILIIAIAEVAGRMLPELYQRLPR